MSISDQLTRTQLVTLEVELGLLLFRVSMPWLSR